MSTGYSVRKRSKTPLPGNILFDGMINMGELKNNYDYENRYEANEVLKGEDSTLKVLQWPNTQVAHIIVPLWDEEAVFQHNVSELKTLHELIEMFYLDTRVALAGMVQNDPRFKQNYNKDISSSPDTPEIAWLNYHEYTIGQITEKNGYIWFSLNH